MGEPVPWYNSAEWLSVFDNLTSKSFVEAFEQIKLWKLRVPTLPAGVESTLGILLPICRQDRCPDESTLLLRCVYSSTIVRFMNHMLDEDHKKTKSMATAAKTAGIPDWLVRLRHDIAHDHSLPSLGVLRDAADFALEWLKKNYWVKHKVYINDYISGKLIQSKSDEEHVKNILGLYTSINICYSSCQIRFFNDITDETLRESLLIETNEILGDDIDLQSLRSTPLIRVINMIATTFKKCVKQSNVYKTIIAKDFVDSNSLFLSVEVTEMFNFSESDDDLSDQYVNCFKNVLILVQNSDAILDVVKRLLHEVGDENVMSGRRKLCALWLSQILHALHKSLLFEAKSQIFNTQKYVKYEQRVSTNMELSFTHWFPNQAYGLFLNLGKLPPKELMDINFMKPYITVYNPYLKFFIKDMAMLVRPKMPAASVNHILNLSELIATDSFDPVPDTVYTVKDLAALYEDDSNGIDTTTQDNVLPVSDNTAELEELDDTPQGSWKLASLGYNWSSIPIGQILQKSDPPMDVDAT